MVFCKACGAKVPDGTLFCPSCGRPMNMPAGKDYHGRQGNQQASSGGTIPQQAPVAPQQAPVAPSQIPVVPPQIPVVPQQAPVVPPQVPVAAQQVQEVPPQVPVGPPHMPVIPGAFPPAVPGTAAVKKNKPGTFKFVLAGMLTLMFLAVLAVGVFGFTQGWFTNGEEEPQANASPSETTAEPTTEPTLLPSEGELFLVEHRWEGVTIYLQEETAPYHWDEDYMKYTRSQVDIQIDSYIPGEISDSIVSSRSFAELYKTELADNYRQIGIYNRGEVYYIQGIYNNSNVYEVTAFYMAGDYAYSIMVTDEGTEQMDEMIRIATTARIDESVIPAISTSDGKVEVTDTPSYKGLTLQMHQELEEDGFYERGVGYENEYISMMIEQGTVEDYWADITDSASLAQCNLMVMEDLWQEVSVETFNGRSYVLCRDDDGYTCVVGCYVRNGQWWEVSAYFHDFEVYTADVIRGVTSGTFQ